MEHINKQLKVNINKKGLNNIAESSYVCHLFEKNKENLINLPCKAISFSYGILKIKTENSAIATEIKMRTRGIIDGLNKKLGKETVEDVVVRVIT